MIDLKKIAAFAFGLGYLMKISFITIVWRPDHTTLTAISITSVVWYNMAAVVMWVTLSKDLRNNRVLNWISAGFCFLEGEIFFPYLYSKSVHKLQQHCHAKAFFALEKKCCNIQEEVTIDLRNKIDHLRKK